MDDVDPYELRVRNIALGVDLVATTALRVLEGSAASRRADFSAGEVCRAQDLTLERRVEILERLRFRLR